MATRGILLLWFTRAGSARCARFWNRQELVGLWQALLPNSWSGCGGFVFNWRSSSKENILVWRRSEAFSKECCSRPETFLDFLYYIIIYSCILYTSIYIERVSPSCGVTRSVLNGADSELGTPRNSRTNGTGETYWWELMERHIMSLFLCVECSHAFEKCVSMATF